MLPDYCKKMSDKYGLRVGDVKKLVSKLRNKTNYLVHYSNLQSCQVSPKKNFT